MKTVHKFSVLMDGESRIEMDRSAGIIHVGIQSMITIWACVDTDAPKVLRTFRVFGTGHPIPDDYVPVGTVIDHPYVWHVFERIGTSPSPGIVHEGCNYLAAPDSICTKCGQLVPKSEAAHK